jgi:hypothetical protein
MPLLSSRQFPMIVLALLFFSCTKQNVSGPAGPPGPNGQNGSASVAGKIFGKVQLYDTLGNAISENSSANVTFENANPAVVLTTAADASFTSPDMPAGFYNIDIQQTGFGTMKLFRYQHTGGINETQMGIINLGQKRSSWTDIKRLQVDTVSAYGGHYMVFTLILAHPQTLPFPWVVLYFNHLPGAGNTSNDYTYRTDFYQQDDSTLIFSPFDQDLTEYTNEFNGTDNVYIAAAIDNNRVFTYTDSSENVVYPAIGNLSNEVKVYNNLKN